MPKVKYISFTSILVCLLILLPACNPSRKQHIFLEKKPKKTWSLFGTDQSYKKQKELIKKNKKVKKEIRKLPSRIKNMNKEELEKGKNYNIELGYSDLAIKHLERLIVITENTSKLKKYRLELADLYFEIGEFEKAGRLYTQYLDYYPGSEQREYVEYKEILCRFYMTLHVDRDQTKTKETLALTQQYLEKTDIYTSYVQDVQQIQHASYIKLVESETDIIQFYLRRNKYKAAETRLAYIKNNYLNHIQELKPDILKLEIELANAQGHIHIAEEKRTELATRFPNNNTLQLTKNNKTDHVTTF